MGQDQRKELKRRGLVAMKRNYWWGVLASLILMIITGGSSMFIPRKSYNPDEYRQMFDGIQNFSGQMHGSMLPPILQDSL